MTSIIYEKYKFDINLIDKTLHIKLTHTDLLDVYESVINEDDINVKPIKKFYSMIEDSLNKVVNYNLIITDNQTQLICVFYYNTKMVDIEESITFNKNNCRESKEKLLLTRIKELTILATPIFGYRNFSELMSFNLDTKIIDFRPFDDYNVYLNFVEYNKFKKVNKIIISTDSKIFTCGIKNRLVSELSCGCAIHNDIPNKRVFNHINKLLSLEIDSAWELFHNMQSIYTTHDILMNEIRCSVHGKCNLIIPKIFKPISHFNHPSVYIPSVTEIEVYCSPYNKTMGPYYNFEEYFTFFGSLPNLEKISLIQRDNIGFTSTFLDIHKIISTSPNKKLKTIIFRGMSTWINPDTLDKAKLYAQVNNIILVII